ncbi:MAG: hypothetical protein HC830_08195 [Bacteroidetes bacterium]|nr:hypothetical protein [Bacteroidota bacterium]
MRKDDRIQIYHKWYSYDNYHELLNHNSEPWTAALIDFLTVWYNQSDFIEVNTSGSTGQPKIIRLNKESMVNSATMTCNYLI